MIPTRIMYRANLSWKPMQQILNTLVNRELIVEFTAEDVDKRTKKTYNLTEKGRNVLQYFNKAKVLVAEEKLLRIHN